jgi:hypothetical protein
LSCDDFIDIFPVPSATDRFAVLADGFGGHFHKVVVFLREQNKTSLKFEHILNSESIILLSNDVAV